METLISITEHDTISVVRLDISATCCVSGSAITAGELAVKLQSGPSFALVSLDSLDTLVASLESFTPSKDFVKWQLDGTADVAYYEHGHVDGMTTECVACSTSIDGGHLIAFDAALNNRLSDTLVACHADCQAQLQTSLEAVWDETHDLLVQTL